MSPFQSLWLYTRIKKDEYDQKKIYWDMVKVLATVINPTLAKEVFKEDVHMVTVDNTGFENDLKMMDPDLDLSKFKEVLDGLNE